ncbi:MAG: hypothetical protein HGA65_11670 [Oscillochloris sp.]|nr:hypothetical protein [Oscillochloris sp.]
MQASGIQGLVGANSSRRWRAQDWIDDTVWGEIRAVLAAGNLPVCPSTMMDGQRVYLPNRMSPEQRDAFATFLAEQGIGRRDGSDARPPVPTLCNRKLSYEVLVSSRVCANPRFRPSRYYTLASVAVLQGAVGIPHHP